MRMRLIGTAALAAITSLFLPFASYAQEGGIKPEVYSGVAMGTGGSFGGRSTQFDFRVTRYTTDEEVKTFAVLVREKGPDALRKALEKEDVGRISVTGRVGNQIAIARKRRIGADTVITLITARTMPFFELSRGGRSTGYDLGFMQVRLNAKGEGDGKIMAAAKIRFDVKKGVYEIESYGNQYIKAVNVRQWK